MSLERMLRTLAAGFGFRSVNYIPLSVERVIKSMSSESSGLVVKVLFTRGKMPLQVEPWSLVGVYCGQRHAELSQGGSRQSLCIIRLAPGEHQVEFRGTGQHPDNLDIHIRTFNVSIEKGFVSYIAVKPPRQSPFNTRRLRLDAEWYTERFALEDDS